MFNSVNSILCYFIFWKSLSINFCVRILHRIAVLIMSNVLGVYQSSESGDVAQIVSKSELSALIGCEQNVAQTPSA